MLWLSTLCALVALACALIAIGASRNCARLSDELARALQAVSSQRGTVEALTGAVDSLADQLRTLRGKFYAERRHSPPVDPAPPSVQESKAQLRAQLGLVPGKRP